MSVTASGMVSAFAVAIALICHTICVICHTTEALLLRLCAEVSVTNAELGAHTSCRLIAHVELIAVQSTSALIDIATQV